MIMTLEVALVTMSLILTDNDYNFCGYEVALHSGD